MKKMRFAAVAISMVCALSMISCGGKKDSAKGNAGEAAGYTYGEEKTFHSDEPVTYSIFFSDASWYAKADTWESEGIFKKIEEKTNVHLNVISFDSGDYGQKVNLEINSGNSAYIIPKIYSEDQYVAGGGVVAVSDYTKYMPNYTAFVNKYKMEPDLATIQQSDGKYYRLPGLHQAALQDYTILIRDDYFKAAGYDVRTLEDDWTWEELHDVLVGVKKYMVSAGIISESDYVWSDRWCGESGKGSGGNLLKLMSMSYGVTAGWAIEGSNGGIRYDSNKKEFYSSCITDAYKKFLTVANSFVKDGLLDPESFTQADDMASNKFFNGKTALLCTNRGVLVGDIDGVQKICGKDAELYVSVYPCGTNKYLAENSRLECGVMLSQKALDELGEDGFIKLVRFVDWMFYSEEAYTLCKWGPEGETWHYVTDEATGLKIKALLPGYKCGGLGISGGEDDVDIRLKWGYAGGNYFYGHATALSTDNFTPMLQDLYARYAKYRESAPVDPKAKPTEDEREQLNLWAVPLIDNINAYTLKFITGQKDLNKDWDEYIASCKNLNVEKIEKLTNEIYNR